MTTIRERADAAELRLADLTLPASEADLAKQRAWREYCVIVDDEEDIRLKRIVDTVVKTEYDLIEQCLAVEAELAENCVFLATMRFS